jgi:two-component system sensor histidine kinase/response regulator
MATDPGENGAVKELGEQETILVIDDESTARLSCKKILSRAGFHVETFEDGVQGLEGVARLKPSLVLVDLKMPGISGIEVITRVHNIDPQTIVVVITGYATVDTAVEAMKSGAYDFLPKPFSAEELRLIVRRGIERRRLVLESRRHEVERALLERRFITFVSHQLQSPLVAIHQYLDVLKKLDASGSPVSKKQEWLGRCLRRTEEMQTLIRDWLTLARVEGGSLSGQRVRVDLKRVISDVLHTNQDMAAAEGVSLEALLPEKSCFVNGDPSSLSVLLENLVVNAIRYNKPGGKVTVSAEARDGEILVEVTDTGVGIAEEYRPFLFNEFFRVKTEGTKKTSGTGLGLPICRKIVAEMGGSIEVESEVNVGSTFRARLPAYREEPEGDERNVSSR